LRGAWTTSANDSVRDAGVADGASRRSSSTRGRYATNRSLNRLAVVLFSVSLPFDGV